MPPMEPEILDKWRRAGKVAAQALEYGGTLCKPGINVNELCAKIEQKIIELGAKPAWPAQASMNEVAAHYTPEPDDETVLKDQVVSIDVGAHVDGFIGDNALTVDLSGDNAKLVEASKAALAAAQAMLKPGVGVAQLGAAIVKEIESRGLKSVRNLTGHGIAQWVIHTAPTVPNYESRQEDVLEEGQIIAIEPFATTGDAGMVHELPNANIYALQDKRSVRSMMARQALSFIQTEFNTLPFTTRSLLTKFDSINRARFALHELDKAGILHSYPPLAERSKGLTSVWEKTFYITADGAEIMTQP